jgi:type IV pilus assembly protein PilX
MRMNELGHINRNSGSVLLVSLIMLLVLTVIGVSTMSNIGVNEKMAANYRDHNLAFQAAEAALAAGEQRAGEISGIFDGIGLDNVTDHFPCADSNSNCFTSTCLEGLCFTGTYDAISGGGASAGICETAILANNLWESAATWTATGVATSHPVSIQGVYENPKYIIEFMCYVLADPDVVAATTPPSYGNDWAHMFRITAFGRGATANSKAMLQSTFKVLR